jgi:hypothetical protein
MTYTQIDTDYAIGSILSRFDSEYITNVIQTSIENRFRPFSEPMPNMVSVLARQFKGVLDNAPDYADKVLEVETQTYQEICQMICQYYNLELDINNDQLYGNTLRTFAFTLYDIFVSRFTEYIIQFYTSYIMRNLDFIYSYLANNEDTKKARENSMQAQKMYTNPKFALVHSNLNQVIINMAAYDISLQELLSYITDPNTAAFLCTFIADKGDIYKYHYATFITDKYTMSGILTSVKLQLQEQTITQNEFNYKNEE